MKKVLLISESQIKTQSIIESGVDSKVISKTIHNVQEVHLKSILGSELYQSLLDAVALQVQSGTTLSESYSTLLNDYIHPYLINAVIADLMIVNQYKITNKGILKMNDNSANNVSPDELGFAKDYFDNYSDSFKKKLVDYLKDNQLISTSCNDINTTSNSIGWFLD